MEIIKKSRCFLIYCFLTILLSIYPSPVYAINLSAEETEYLNKKGRIVFVSQTRYPPFEFVDKNKEHDGMMIDIIRWMAMEIGFKPVFTDMTFQQAQEAVLTGKADILTSLFYSKKREEKFEFTDTLFNVPASIFVKAERTDIKSLKDLNAKIISIQKGDYAKEFLESNKIWFDNLDAKDFGEATEMVISGKADAIIGDEQIVLYHIFSNRLTDRIKKVGEPLYTGKNCMASKKGNSILIGILKKGTDEARKSGLLDKINKKWLGTIYSQDKSFLQRYLWPFIFVVGGILLLSLWVWAWNVRLRMLDRKKLEIIIQSEEALRENEAKFRTLFDSANDSFCLMDHDIFIECNPKTLEMFGCTKEQIIGQPPYLFSPEFQPDGRKSIEKAQEKIKAALGGQRQFFEWKHRRYDGSLFDAEVSLNTFRIMGKYYLQSTVHDISERKLAEATLKQTRQNYESFFNTIDEFLFVLDEQGNIIHINSTVIDRLGYTREDLLGKSVLIIHPPERRDEAGRIVNEMLSGLTDFCPVPIITKFGVQIPVETTVSSGFWNGKPAIFGVTKDISKIKFSEEKFSKIFHINPSACGLSDLDNDKYIDVNEAFYYLFGFGKDEVIGKTPVDLGLTTPDGINSILLKADINGNVSNVEAALKAKNGDIKHVLLSSENIFVQDKKYRFTVVNDITERKQTEHLLKIQHELLLELNSCSDLDLGAEKVLKAVLQFECIDSGAIYTAEPDDGSLNIVFHHGLSEEFAAHVSHFPAGSPNVRMVSTGKAQYGAYSDIRQITDKIREKEGLRAFAIIPIMSKGRLIALLNLASHFNDFIPINTRSALETIAFQIGSTLLRLRTDAALRESEEKYRFLIENSHDIIYTLNLDGIFSFVSSSWTVLLGHSIDQVVGKSYRHFIHNDDIEKCQAFIQLIFETGERQTGIEYRVQHKDGSWRWHNSNGVPIKDNTGAVVGYEGIAIDITERKQTELALWESEARFRELSDLLPQVVYETDNYGHLKYANRIAFDLFGYTREEFKQGLNILQMIAPDDRERATEAFRKMLEGIVPAPAAEYLAFRKDGSTFPVLIYSSPVIVDEKIIGLRGIIIDNTERNQAEKTLLFERHKFFTSLENAPFGMALILQNGTFSYINQKFREIFGYEPEDIPDGKTWCRKAYPNATYRHEIISVWKDDLKKTMVGERRPKEFVVTCKDGSSKTINFIPVKLATGDNIMSCEDITERRKAEEALRESELKYRSLIESSSDAIFCVNENGEYKFTNHLFASTLGKSPDYFLGKTFWDIYPKEHADQRYEVTKRIFQTGKSESVEVEVPLQDKTMYFYATANPIKDETGKVILNLTHATDITERKQAEEERINSGKKLQAFFEFNPDPTSITDINTGKIIEVNQAFLDWSGNKKEELIGKTTKEIQFWVDPNDRDRMVQILTERGKVDDLELQFHTKDGSLHVILFSAWLVNVGKDRYMLSRARDITERKREEEERQKLEERLSRSEKMEALGTLAGGVAHDLNNVLGIVIGYAELLLSEVDRTSPIKEHLESIHSEGRRAAAMIEDMLTMTRRGVQSRLVLNLNNIILDIEKSSKFTQLTPEHSPVQIKIDLDSDLLNISGSPVHLTKSVFNLMLNASEAMPKGGILTISTSNQYLEKPIKGYDEVRSGDYVVLSVNDTGTGINAKDLKRIFEPFYTKKIMGRSGTGLGLAVVWSTVKDHNGYIDVQSEEGKGSTFTLYFPVSREEITPESVSISITEYMGKGENIIIVDDVKGQRDIATEMLRKLNYNVSSVSSGEEAVEYLKDHEIDLMLLDMIMDPGMDGLDTYKAILEIRPKQKAIIVSGYSETDRVEQAHALGAGAYLKKPYVFEKLGLAIRNELNRCA